MSPVGITPPQPTPSAPAGPDTPASPLAPEGQPDPNAEYGIGYYAPSQLAYPPLARARREEGTVVLRVDVDATGQPTRVVVITSSGSALLDAAAIDEIRNYRFIPRRRGQTPIAGDIDVPVRYSLADPSAAK